MNTGKEDTTIHLTAGVLGKLEDLHDKLTKPEELIQFIERIERLEKEKSGLSADVSELYKSAKDVGFDPKAMREVIKRRKMKDTDKDELDTTVHLYEQEVDRGREIGVG